MGGSDVSGRVGAFYETHPYPAPVDDVDAYRARWDEARRRAESHLFWPNEPYRDDRSVLVAGCGTNQAVHYAVRWPKSRVVGIDVSASSLAFSEELRRRHRLDNLELRELPIERAAELGQPFDCVVCTGVLHHLPDPDAGLRALRNVLAENGALHLMVYAPYGRAGVYLLQDYCRCLGVGHSDQDLRELAASLKALPPEHPIVPLLRNSSDFATTAGLADALLHPLDRAYSVPQLLEFIARADLHFGRWLRQAPYLPTCGAIAATPHGAKVAALPAAEQYAAMELFRGAMVRHSAIVYANETAAQNGDWLEAVPIRLPETIEVRERLPDGAAAVLINRNHPFTDLYLPIDTEREKIFKGIDGTRTVANICDGASRSVGRAFFEQLWRWDQVVFDTSRSRGA